MSALTARLLPNPDTTRNAWVRAYLKKLKPGLKLLDAGCGPQPFRPDCAHLKYHAQDFGQYEGKDDGTGSLHDGSRWHYGKLDYTGDIWNIKGAKNASFDVILCTEVFEHIPYPVETMREFGRLLKKGGIAIVTAPVDCLPHQTPYFFYHGFSKQFYQRAGADAGLKLTHYQTYSGAIDFLLLESYRVFRSGPWLAKPFAAVAVLPLLLARLLGLQGPEHPCFGGIAVLKKT